MILIVLVGKSKAKLILDGGVEYGMLGDSTLRSVFEERSEGVLVVKWVEVWKV